MTQKEQQADELIRRKEWNAALQLYDQILSSGITNLSLKYPKERLINCYLGKLTCAFELQKFDIVINDCQRLLKIVDIKDLKSTLIRVRRYLIHGLYKLKRYTDAETICNEWIQQIAVDCKQNDLVRVLECYKTVIQMANGQKTNQRINIHRIDEEMKTVDLRLERLAMNTIQDQFSSNNSKTTGSEKIIKMDNQLQGLKLSNQGDGDGSELVASLNGNLSCSYCGVSFNDRAELRNHCQTEAHQNVIMSDEGMY